MKQLSRIPNVSNARSPPLFYLTPTSPNPVPRESEGASERAYLLSVGSSQVLSDGRLGGWGWGSDRRERKAGGVGEERRSKSGLNRARMALLRTSRGRRGGAGLLLVII